VILALAREHTNPEGDGAQALEPVTLPAFLASLLYVPTEHPAYQGKSRLRLWVFLYLVAAPWIWVTTGLYILHDHRIAIALYALLCCLLPALVLGREPDSLRFLPLNAKTGGIAASIAAGALVLLGGWFFLPLLTPLVDFNVLAERLTQIRITPGHFWPFAFYFIVVNPMVEELFWRGLVYRELTYVTEPKIALLLSSFFFGFWHWVMIQHFFVPFWVPWITLVIMMGGFIFGALYQRTGTLMGPIVVHALGADLPIVIIVWNCIQRMQ